MESRTVIPIRPPVPVEQRGHELPLRQMREGVGSDPVTRLLNRAAFELAYARISAARRRPWFPLTLVVLDIDRFSSLPQCSGPAGASALLRLVGDTLRGSLRRTDVLARWDRDRFVALLPHTEQAGALGATEKALRRVHAEAYVPVEGETVRLTLSAGVGVVGPQCSLDRALAACFRYVRLAKAVGGGRILSAAGEVLPRPTRVVMLLEAEPFGAAVAHHLTRVGCDVCRVRTGREVMMQVASARPCLILLDLCASEVDGSSLLEQLRLREEPEAVPILVLRGRSGEAPRAAEELVDQVLRIMDRNY